MGFSARQMVVGDEPMVFLSHLLGFHGEKGKFSPTFHAKKASQRYDLRAIEATFSSWLSLLLAVCEGNGDVYPCILPLTGCLRCVNVSGGQLGALHLVQLYPHINNVLFNSVIL